MRCFGAVITLALLLTQGCVIQGTPQPSPGSSSGSSSAPSSGPGLKWYSSCGDPVCGRPGASPAPNTCGSRVEGQACSVEGERCDLGNDCNQHLVCARTDPKLQPGGCPISKPIYKQNIRMLGPLERQQLAQRIYNLPLASWQYRFEPQGPERIGFLIEAATPPELVKPDGNSVDLYGYTSLAVAAVQDQQARVNGLEQRLLSLEARLAAAEARCGKTP